VQADDRRYLSPGTGEEVQQFVDKHLISVELIRMFAEIDGLQDVYGPADLQGIQGGTFDQASDGVENGRR